MAKMIFSKFKRLDYMLLIPYLVLMAIGLVMIYSASSDVTAIAKLNPATYLIRQAIFIVIGLFLAAFVFMMRLDVFQNKIFIVVLYILLVASLGYLVGLQHFRPSAAINGATAWIKVGFFNIQPTEFAKIFVVLYMARMIAPREKRFAEGEITGVKEFFKQLIRPLILCGLILLLVILEPDTGGFAILVFIIFVMIITSGLPSAVGGSFLVALLGIVSLFYWLIDKLPMNMSQGYKFQRIMSFVHPFQLEKSGGAQLVNSYYAISNGGLFGVGLGNSIQKRGYLAEPYTDFILSIISEELGLIGAAVILGLIFFLIIRIFLIGSRSKNTWNALVSFGIGAMLLIQTIFNVGGMLGLLPITGVTLPFISYGGSSMMVLSISMGLMLNISASQKKKIQNEEEHIHTPYQRKGEE